MYEPESIHVKSFMKNHLSISKLTPPLPKSPPIKIFVFLFSRGNWIILRKLICPA